jgi:hypothetical protein
MLQWERGRVLSVSAPWRGVQELRIAPSGDEEGVTDRGEEFPALSYPELLGEILPGEEVLLNSNALRRGLGTGGQALVVARTGALPQSEAPRGHMVKARYTPMQTVVDALDDPDSPHRAVLERTEDLGGMPVVLADLHSALPAIVAGIRERRPGARIAYIMSDGAALPAAYSRTVAKLRESGDLVACISAGQAFGGDLEAVTVHTALLGARAVARADVAILSQGPGNLGTGTTWGFSGIQAAEGLHAASVLGGTPVAALRVSGADGRERHRGVSHHSLTFLGRAALAPAVIPVLSAPDENDGHCSSSDSELLLSVREQLENAVVAKARSRGVDHRVVEVAEAGLLGALREAPVPLRTMGRGLEEDTAPFLFAAAAGRLAADLAGPGAAGDQG